MPKYSNNSPVSRSIEKNIEKTITSDFQDIHGPEEIPSMKDFIIFPGSRSNR